jgi:hypothetical protein
VWYFCYHTIFLCLAQSAPDAVVEKRDLVKYNKNKKGDVEAMDAIFYTVQDINGDYAYLVTEDGGSHSITMFLLPEGTTVGSRLKLENFQWELV